MREPRRETQVFIVSFCLSLVILGSVLLLTLFLSRLAAGEESSSHHAAVLPSDVAETEDLTLLLIGCDSLSEEPRLIWLVSYSGDNGAVTAAVFPPDTLCTSEDRTDTLSGHYTYGGILGLRRAVFALTGCLPDRYLRLERNGIAALADQLGGLTATLESSFSVGKEMFLPGEQHLSGRKLAALLLSQTADGRSDCAAQAKWGEQLLDEKLSRAAGTDSLFFDTLFEYGETSLTRYDLLLRQEHFSKTATGRSIHFAVLSGTYDASLLAMQPDDGSLQEIKELFAGKKEGAEQSPA